MGLGIGQGYYDWKLLLPLQLDVISSGPISSEVYRSTHEIFDRPGGIENSYAKDAAFLGIG